MIIIPFKKVGQFNFNNDYYTVKNSIHSKFREDTLEVIDKKYPRIYVEDLDLMINFEENSKSIRFFEFFKDAKEVIFMELDLISEPYSIVEKEIVKNDPDILIEKLGLESKSLGFTISRGINSNVIESVLIGSKSYVSEKEIDLNELYKSIMGEDYPN